MCKTQKSKVMVTTWPNMVMKTVLGVLTLQRRFLKASILSKLNQPAGGGIPWMLLHQIPSNFAWNCFLHNFQYHFMYQTSKKISDFCVLGIFISPINLIPNSGRECAWRYCANKILDRRNHALQRAARLCLCSICETQVTLSLVLT